MCNSTQRQSSILDLKLLLKRQPTKNKSKNKRKLESTYNRKFNGEFELHFQ